MEIKSVDELKGKKIKLNYNSTVNEIQREEGIVVDINEDFIILKSTYGEEKIKYISKRTLVRLEVIE